MTDTVMQPPALLTACQRIVQAARRYRGRPAIVGHDDVVHSFDDVLTGLARFTAALAELGVREGQLVGLECPYHAHHLYLRLGCQALGAATVSFTAAELETPNRLARACDLFIQTDPASVTAAAQSHVITVDWLDTLLSRPVRDDILARLEAPNPPERTVRLLKTSGTTGESKAIAVSERVMMQRWEVYFQTPVVDDHRCRLIPFPAGMEEGTSAACEGIMMGELTVYAHKDRVLSAIDRFRVTECKMIAANAEDLLARVPPAWVRPRRLEIEVYGGALRPGLRAALLAQVGTSVESHYTSRETGHVAVIDEAGFGQLLPDVEIDIRDADGNTVAAGEVGRICIRSPRIATGYFDNPTASRAAFRDGWYISNDVGSMPAPGRLQLLGRTDDILNIAGLKVPSGHLEGQMRDIPGVIEAALVSIRDTLGVEQLAAMLEVPPGIPVDPILAEAGRLAARFASCKVVTVHQLPRTETGKVRKFQVERWFRHHLGLPDA